AQVMLLQRHRWGRRFHEEPALFREAAQQREAFARANGYVDFEHMMRVGIQRARMPGEAGSGSKSLNQALVEAGLQPMAPAEEMRP
ncbi:MAG: hypothetical protein KGL26_01140, partial [Pseudomonadota bacterium]|nr:hypothetical protein [Pseudomonadota bacterium]